MLNSCFAMDGDVRAMQEQLPRRIEQVIGTYSYVF